MFATPETSMPVTRMKMRAFEAVGMFVGRRSAVDGTGTYFNGWQSALSGTIS